MSVDVPAAEAAAGAAVAEVAERGTPYSKSEDCLCQVLLEIAVPQTDFRTNVGDDQTELHLQVVEVEVEVEVMGTLLLLLLLC